MRRYRPAALAAAILAAILVIVFAGSRDVAVTSPSPSPTSTATAAAPTPSASPSPTASPLTAVGHYVSALLGYSIELPPPWHRSACMGVVTQQTPTPFGESFVSVSVRDEAGSDVGVAYPVVGVSAEANPQGLSPRQWADQLTTGRAGQRIDDVTFAGRPAARISHRDTLPSYYVASAGRMYLVSPDFRQLPEPAMQQTTVRIVESFRFITEAEQAAARAALPTAAPPLTPEQVADGVAAALAAKDDAALAGFLAPCASRAGEQAGGTTVSREKYLDDLRAAFAAGLVVTVRPRPFEGDRATGQLTVASTWQDPRDPKGPLDRKLMLRRGQNDRWEWWGTLERYR